MADESTGLNRAVDDAGAGAAYAPHVAMDDWLQRLRPALSAFLLRRLRDPADLEDALQEVSLRAWRYVARTDIRAPVSFCFRLAENVSIDLARARDRSPVVDTGDRFGEFAVEDVGPDRRAVVMQELELVKRVIARLPAGCRHVFLLSRSHGLSNREISERCGVSIKLVEKQITRALRTLREQARLWEGERP
jgi:RNA polymerase sigma factor (sigma-70 family)